MLKNYIKIAWRNLLQRKGYTSIHIIGLSVGLAACLLIGLYVQDEFSYDDFHENADRTYRVLREFDLPELKATITNTPPALAPALEENLTAVEEAVRVSQTSPVVEYGSKKFVESSFVSSESGFFEIFSVPLARGVANLDRPNTIVITEAMATKYFSGENPMEKNLRVDGEEYEVTGVLAEIPENSHLQFDFIASLDSPEMNWNKNNFGTYLMLGEDHSKEALTSQIADLIRSYADFSNQRADDVFIPHLQPITGIHLGQGVSVNIDSQGNIMYLYLFITLAVFIVLLACINFINLATARSAERAREVGMRKTLGAGRAQIAAQFLGESIMITAIAFTLALSLSQMILPFLNNLADKSLSLSAFYSAPQILFILIVVLGIGILAGCYPALILSGFHPSRVVKGTVQGAGGDRLRKGLVVFQFVISISLLVGTGVIYKQLNFMKSTGLGFNENNVVLIERANFLGNQTDFFKQQISKIPGVKQATTGFSMPGTFFMNSMWEAGVSEGESKNLDYSFVGFNYAETLDIEIIAGRSFSKSYSTDSTAAIINEAAVQEFGWSPEEAIGKPLARGGREFTVVGVAKNFHYESLHAEIYPMALFGPLRSQRYVAARLSTEDVSSTLTSLQNTWSEFSELPFHYSFLADNFETQYKSEDRLIGVFGVFAGLAILIGCMGLLGLAAFMASKRTKEIGIRKVLGATVTSIVSRLSKDFIKLVGLGFVIAVPIAWYTMNQWLVNFAYRIEIGPGIFAFAGGVALFIALATVSWQSIKAAVANPVESLRSE